MQAKQQIFNEHMYNNTHSKIGPMIQSEFVEFAKQEFSEMKGNNDFKNLQDSVSSKMLDDSLTASIFHTYFKAKIPEAKPVAEVPQTARGDQTVRGDQAV